MVRTQIQFEEAQHRWLKRWASRLGVSVSEAVRRCVADRQAAEVTTADRASRLRDARAVCGKYTDPSGPSRVAKEHDRHLATAYRR
jgi:hypothetical protein